MAKWIWTKQRKEDLARLLEEGKTASEIAVALNCNEDIVLEALDKVENKKEAPDTGKSGGSSPSLASMTELRSLMRDARDHLVVATPQITTLEWEPFVAGVHRLGQAEVLLELALKQIETLDGDNG